MPQDLMKDDDVAALIGVNRITIWKWVRTVPDFPKPIKIGPKTTRWRPEDIRAYIAAQVAE